MFFSRVFPALALGALFCCASQSPLFGRNPSHTHEGEQRRRLLCAPVAVPQRSEVGREMR